jgi:hypothetical protein
MHHKYRRVTYMSGLATAGAHLGSDGFFQVAA